MPLSSKEKEAKPQIYHIKNNWKVVDMVLQLMVQYVELEGE